MITESNFLSEYQQANQQEKGVILTQELSSCPADITQLSAKLERHQEFLTILESNIKSPCKIFFIPNDGKYCKANFNLAAKPGACP